jgi:hypothetical protein
MGNHWRVIVLCGLVGGCVGEVGESGDFGSEVACTDVKYGDGVCDIDTSCDVVDVDCLVAFDTPDAAKAWYDASGIAAVKGPSVSTTDARFAPTQSLIDEGWAAYKSIYSVGDLADKRVQLVLVQNDAVNAFVIPDKDLVRAGLVVMVNTGLVDLNAPKAQVLGVIMHEFQHAMGLHVNRTVKDRMRTYYKAPATSEPIGNTQVEDPAVRAAFEGWKDWVSAVGYASDAELSGLPLMSLDVSSRDTLGFFGVYFLKLIKERQAANPTTACTTAYNSFISLYSRITGLARALDNGYSLASTETTNIVNAITALRDNCFTGVTGDAITHLARLLGANEATLRAALPPELKTAIEGKTVVTGWFNAINAGRTKLRELEAAFKTQSGVSWDRLRYFSTEEAADDVSARIMRKMGLAADGAGQLLVSVDSALSSACMPMLSSGSSIPYGENLIDDHHATCWRTQHQQVIGASVSARLLPTWQPLGPASHVPALERIAPLPVTIGDVH